MKIQTTKVFSELDNSTCQYIVENDIRKRKYTTISCQGSSRSSKTYNTLIWLIAYLLKHPHTRLSIVRASLPSLKGSVFVDFKEIVRKFGLYDERMLNKSELVYTFPNESWVEFFSTDAEQKIRGRKRDILFANEANELKFIEWQQLKMRTTQFAIIDYNPSFTDEHWISALNKESRTYHFITTYKDNPFLEQTIIDEIEGLQHKNKSLWTIYGMGLQSAIEGLIFENVSIIDNMPDNLKKEGIGLDFGYTNDPTAACHIGVNHEETKLYIDEIVYRTRMLSSDISDVLKPHKMKVISESADPRLIDEIYNAGVNIYPVEKFKGSIMAGISKMLEFEICITKRSTHAIKEFKNYTYAQDKEGKWINEPIDSFNHIIDAARYWVLSEILGHNFKMNYNTILNAFR